MPSTRRAENTRLTRAAQVLRSAWAAVDTLVFPPACAVCGGALRDARVRIVCALCLSRLTPLRHPQCHRCGHPRRTAEDPSTQCAWCERFPAHVRAVRSAVRLDTGTGAALIHALKYGGWHALAADMARAMAHVAFPDDVSRERAALVPVPLSGTRLRERGFNQAERLAVALSVHWKIPVWSDVVVRTRHTRSQVRLTPSQRAGNVSGAFTVPAMHRARIRGQHLMLVDDVLTTGATLAAVAQSLVDSGTRITSFVTFGRAPDPGDRVPDALDPDLD